MRHIAYIALGANLQEPLRQLQQALQHLAEHAAITVLACSSFYRSAPVGPQDQDDFINAACQISTELAPDALLAQLQRIESAHGRQRLRHWGPRSLDLDLLFYDDLVLHDAQLTLPHPRIAERAFVLYPLHDLLGDAPLPDGRVWAQLWPGVAGQRIERLHTSD